MKTGYDKSMIKTKPIVLGAVLFALFLITPVAKADSYDGPFCFEKTDTRNAEDDSAHVRGTCRELEFERIVSLDSSVSQYFFVAKEGAATTSGPITLKPGYEVGDSAIRFEEVDELYTGDIVYGHPVYLSSIASDDAFSEMSLAASGISFVDVYGKPTTKPRSVYYKSRGGVYVPVTSPVTKVVEYWHITSKPNGFMLVKDKTETYLDDGSMKTSMNSPVAAASTTPVEPAPTVSWWSRIADFFKNLF